ncbi:MAG: NACHT domain-containing protein [Leptolyngbya sp. SIO3F4]|nr:NACHT domain-containing protein [Leptolyngbya sp. SIO3F4]
MMLGNGTAVESALLLVSTDPSDPNDPVKVLFQWLKDLMPPWLWAVLFIGVFAFLFVIDVGDKLSGILGWLGVPSPFQRAQPFTGQVELTRQELLKIVKKEVNRRLTTSLHNLVKLDLYMEDQRQRVGNPKLEMVLEDSEPSFQSVNRVLHTKIHQRPLNLRFTQKIIEIFERQDIQGKLLILGEPGSGKTTELLQLAQDLVARAEKDKSQAVPIILELSTWHEMAIDKWVASQLKKVYSVSVDTTQQWLAGNQILLMLDGLDELGLIKQRRCIEQINQFLEENCASELLVCCRREEYEAGQIKLDSLNGSVYLEPLQENQIREYFEKLNRSSFWENVGGNPALLELTQKPLFLFILVLAYQGNPIRNEQELFDACIEKQLHDSNNQGTYKPGKELIPQQTRHYLIWLAKQLEHISETEFLIEGLQPFWLSSPKQKRLYRLLVWLAITLVIGTISGVIIGLRHGLMQGLVKGLISGLIFGLFFGLDTLDIKYVEKLQWSFRELIGGLIGGLIVGLIGGSIIGLIVGLIGWLIVGLLSLLSMGWGVELILGLRDGLILWLFSGLVFGLIFGLFGGLFVGLIVWFSEGLISVSIAEKDMPNQGIRKSIQNSLRMWLIVGLIVGLIYGPSDGPSLGLMGGLMGGLHFGLKAAIQHFVLRILLTKYGYAPWNYALFLEHAVKHRFIQRTGGRYRFVHDLLRKHFAAMPLE